MGVRGGVGELGQLDVRCGALVSGVRGLASDCKRWGSVQWCEWVLKLGVGWIFGVGQVCLRGDWENFGRCGSCGCRRSKQGRWCGRWFKWVYEAWVGWVVWEE